MAVPYSDVSKAVNDLLNKDYPLNSIKTEFKLRSYNGVNYTLTGVNNSKTGQVSTEIKTAFKDYNNGLTLTETWNNASVFGLKAELDNKITKGLKIELDSHFNFNKSVLSSKATISYKAPDVHARLLANLLDGPVVTGDVVAVKNGFLAGTAVAFDSKTSNVTRYDATVGYANPEFALTFHAEKYLKHFSAGYIQRVNLDTEFAARVTYNTEAVEKAVGIEIGTKHQIDRTTSLKAKINNNAILGLGLTHSLQPGVKVTVGSSIDVSKSQEAAHKFGVHFVLEK